MNPPQLFATAWPALQQRIQQYQVAADTLDTYSWEEASNDIRTMLDAWVTHQADPTLALRWLHSQPFPGLVIPEELLP